MCQRAHVCPYLKGETLTEAWQPLVAPEKEPFFVNLPDLTKTKAADEEGEAATRCRTSCWPRLRRELPQNKTVKPSRRTTAPAWQKKAPQKGWSTFSLTIALFCCLLHCRHESKHRRQCLYIGHEQIVWQQINDDFYWLILFMVVYKSRKH